MQDSIKVRGIVLKAEPIGEYDKRVVILTGERGKITAFARGARRQGSRLLAAAGPFCYGEFVLYSGRNSYSMMEAVIHNYFEGMREDVEAVFHGLFFLELMDYYTRENNDERKMLNLLYQSLKALLHPAYRRSLVRYIFEIKALVLNGEYPGIPDTENWERGTVLAMEHIVCSGMDTLYTFAVSESVLRQLHKIAEHYRKRFLDKKLPALELLDLEYGESGGRENRIPEPFAGHCHT